jgi:aconitate hydratase
MNKTHNLFGTLQRFDTGCGQTASFYSLPALEKAGVGPISRLPVSIRLVLESVLRNCDGKKVTEASVRQLAQWQPNAPRTQEIPFIVARIVLQDFTGVPLLVDLAAMRSAMARLGKNPKIIEPLVPVDLVVDHSVQVDFAGTSASFIRSIWNIWPKASSPILILILILIHPPSIIPTPWSAPIPIPP